MQGDRQEWRAERNVQKMAMELRDAQRRNETKDSTTGRGDDELVPDRRADWRFGDSAVTVIA